MVSVGLKHTFWLFLLAALVSAGRSLEQIPPNAGAPQPQQNISNGGPPQNAQDTVNFVDAAKRIVAHHGDLVRQHVANGSVKWHMEHDEELGCTLVQVIKDQVWVTIDGSDRPQKYAHVVLRLEAVLEILDKYLAICRQRRPCPDFSFFLCTMDSAFSARNGRVRLALTTTTCSQSISLPAYQHLSARHRDPDWRDWQAYIGRLQDKYDAASTWASRTSKAVHRGRPSPMSIVCSGDECTVPNQHVYVGVHNWQKYARYRLLYLRSQRPDLLDVAFPPDVYPFQKEWNYTFNTTAYPADEPRFMTLEEQAARFKYAVYVEGWYGWADRLKLLFMHGFLVLLQDTSCGEYYRHLFQPWVHYVPVDGKLTNLTDAIEWAQRHDAEARAIAIRGQRHAFHVFNRHNIERYMYAVLNDVRRLNELAAAGRPAEPLPGAVLYNKSAVLTATPVDTRDVGRFVRYNESVGWWVPSEPPPGES